MRIGFKKAALAAVAVVCFAWTTILSQPADSSNTPSIVLDNPLINLSISDKPNDVGGTLMLQWASTISDNAIKKDYDGIRIYRSLYADSAYELVATLPATATGYEDAGLVDGLPYYYKIVAFKGDTETPPLTGQPGIASGQWFHTGRIPILIIMIIFCAMAVIFISKAKGGYTFYVRPIAGINAVDEAIGRATEMGRPILYVPGLGSAADVATIAAFTILARVAKKTAEYNTRVIVPNYDPVVMTVCQEVVKEAYTSAGKPDLYDSKDIYYVTQDQFPYTAAVNGIILRERTATNFYMGMFYAESLVLAETGFVAGSIQIAGTDQLVQIPFFVCACDFVLMGEELYAASAYLSKEPQQLGTLKAQDWGKVIVVALIIIGTLLSTIGFTDFALWFNVG
jgi:hypothetical protein